MKPTAYKFASLAVEVALCAGGAAVLVSASLTADGKEGLLVLMPDHVLWDVNGDDFEARVRCLREEQQGNPARFELYLEPVR
jgi:hypothetical protein